MNEIKPRLVGWLAESGTRRYRLDYHTMRDERFLVTGERPYKCHLPDCGRAFIQLSNLQQHLRNHDAQVERAKNRPFHCNICGKGFATESSLRTHTSKVSHVCTKSDVQQQQAFWLLNAVLAHDNNRTMVGKIRRTESRKSIKRLYTCDENSYITYMHLR